MSLFGNPKIRFGRFPFLLVDRVVELDFQKSAVGYKNITMNDNFFTGHFPERAIMPGAAARAATASAAVCTPAVDTLVSHADLSIELRS